MCFCLLSVATLKHQDKKQLGQEMLYFISIPLCSLTSKHVEVGTPSRNLEAVAEADAMEMRSLLACSSGFLQPVLL